ncbi:MAG: hypothetical protein AAGA54_05425 [Myxococcota bacterium]
MALTLDSTAMNVAKVLLSLSLSALVLACGDSSSSSEGSTPQASGGGKTDDVGGCGDIEADFLACNEVSEAETCNIAVRDDYPDAGACCLSDVQPYAMCPAYSQADSCEAVNEEYLGCSNVADSQTCNEVMRDGYPDGGACCGRDFEDYELCAAYVTADTCDEIAEDYQACANNSGEADCEEYLREYYPSGVGCCDLGYDGVCGAYVETTLGSCEAIAADYEDCTNSDDADCEAYLRENYPWGDNCCVLDGFDEMCAAYDRGEYCVEAEFAYINCSMSGEPQDVCDAETISTYPDAGEACCASPDDDYVMCSLFD